MSALPRDVAAAPLLDVDRLSVDFGPPDAPVHATSDVSFSVGAGEVVGIVGESGSGKSVTRARRPRPDRRARTRPRRTARVRRPATCGRMSDRERRSLLGGDIAMIFQDPMTSLNPSFTVAFQLMEAIALHEGGTRRARRARALQLLKDVEIADAERRLDVFPHQLSGGMSQRVMVAMAIACNPRLLIADEPTTALDVTVQAQMLALLLRLQRERGMALVLITHDLGVVAEVAQRVLVMYAGQIVESAAPADLFAQPRHPYTEALLASLPERNAGRRRLASLPASSRARSTAAGCLLSPRCPYVRERCRASGRRCSRSARACALLLPARRRRAPRP
jgi:dipeptide transport system ATP-binding protein